jgi:hypothetical protein
LAEYRRQVPRQRVDAERAIEKTEAAIVLDDASLNALKSRLELGRRSLSPARSAVEHQLLDEAVRLQPD